MTSPTQDTDSAVLDEIRGLARRLEDERSRAVIEAVAIALNPQPLPPSPPEDR
jgi:hypothetical protein